MTFSFPELVANEKSWEPLLVDRASNHIRRDLFRGLTVGVGERDSDHYGGSPALITQICKEMTRWGFAFERPMIGGRKGFKLSNPTHVPTVPTPRPPRQPRDRADGEPVVYKGQRTGGRKRIREALLAGEVLSSKDAIDKFGGSDGNLRAVVAKLQKEGVKFDTHKAADGSTVFAATKVSRDQQRTDEPAKGKAVATTNGRLPLIASISDAHAHNGAELDLPPLPLLGQSIQVAGTFLTRDGTVTLVLRDEENDWLTSIDGHTLDAP